ncbi:hypothetical protein ACF0H5_020035 [Mactra antiquata]
MALLWVIVTIIVASANGMDNTKLWKIPPPRVLWHQNPGLWYVQFQSVACSWSGGRELTDMEVFVRPETKTNLLFSFESRNGLCNKINFMVYLTSQIGLYKIKDPVGSGFTGVYVLPAGDNKSFLISYGCTKMSVFGDKCDDGSIYVMTRMRYPDKKVITKINKALVQLWGITVKELQRVMHKNYEYYYKNCYFPNIQT